MKDFTFRNDTKLLFCNDIRETVAGIAKGKKVMVVYGGGSVKRNGCYEDITGALAEADIPFVDYGGSSREFNKIEEGIRWAKANGVTMIIGAGGASVMDSAKLIAFGYYHEADLWEYLKGRPSYGLERMPLALIPPIRRVVRKTGWVPYRSIHATATSERHTAFLPTTRFSVQNTP